MSTNSFVCLCGIISDCNYQFVTINVEKSDDILIRILIFSKCGLNVVQSIESRFLSRKLLLGEGESNRESESESDSENESEREREREDEQRGKGRRLKTPTPTCWDVLIINFISHRHALAFLGQRWKEWETGVGSKDSEIKRVHILSVKFLLKNRNAIISVLISRSFL